MLKQAVRTNTVDEHVGNRPRLRRVTLGLDQSYVATELGMTQTEFDDYESGKRRFGAERLQKLTKLLNVSPDYFFEDLATP
jgi:transcriptional regulator with XRE-family HTH domain